MGGGNSALEWHVNRFTAAGTRLIDFANNSVWFAVKTTAGSTKPANHWKAVTDTSWKTHSVGAVPLNWAETQIKLLRVVAERCLLRIHFGDSSAMAQSNVDQSGGGIDDAAGAEREKQCG